jgi:hypothetical protein
LNSNSEESEEPPPTKPTPSTLLEPTPLAATAEHHCRSMVIDSPAKIVAHHQFFTMHAKYASRVLSTKATTDNTSAQLWQHTQNRHFMPAASHLQDGLAAHGQPVKTDSFSTSGPSTGRPLAAHAAASQPPGI